MPHRHVAASADEIRSCVCCGSTTFQQRDVLWQDLVDAWELSEAEVRYINRQQGYACVECGSNLRSMALAAAIMRFFTYEGIFQDFVLTPRAQILRVLEINSAGTLTPFLAKLPRRIFVEYPTVDMQRLPFTDQSFDLVVHSDTLEHVPDVLAGLNECRRVLKRQGACIFTIPIISGRLTRDCRSRKPSFHGSSENRTDYRVWTEFGADYWTWVFQSGFTDCRMLALEFPSALAVTAALGFERGLTDKSDAMEFTGERFLPEVQGAIAHEHMHRYAFALDVCRDKIVLDIACGEGYGTHFLSTVAQRACGVDISSDAIDHCQKKYKAENVEFRAGTCTRIPYEDRTFDVVVSFETIEHIAEHEEFIAEIKRVLRPNGILVISTPDRVNYNSARATANPFHVRELCFQEFQSLLSRNFVKCRYWGQRLVAGSIIVELPQPSHNAFQDILNVDSDRIYANSFIAPEYLVAIASDGPLFDTTGVSLYRPQLAAHSEFLDADALRRMLAEATNQVTALRQSLSWKITAPLRRLFEGVSRVFNFVSRR